MILLIDNYDSFIYNIGRYMGKLGRERKVIRNDDISIAQIREMQPDAIIISPGPCSPQNSGICIEMIKELAGEIPMLGICLGHQCIGESFGGKTIKAPKPCHGMTSDIDHDGSDLFMGLPNPLTAARYHSLIVEIDQKTSPLKTIATTDEEGQRISMAIAHKEHPIYGVQFHPESILTPYGVDLIRNFLMLADMWNAENREAA